MNPRVQSALLQSRCTYVAALIAIAAANEYAVAHGGVWGDWLAFVAFALMAAYCVRNVLHCGEVHCAVTAPGFVAAAILMLLLLAGIAHYAFTFPWLVFLASACAGYCVQWAYSTRAGTIFFKR